jgi:TonB family protein
VWRGIRERKRTPQPWFRPSLAWPKLAAAAAGVAIVLVVAISGWRTLLLRPGTVGRALSARETTAKAPVAAAPVAKPSTASGEKAEPVVSAARIEAAGRSDELDQIRAAAGRDQEKINVGYAAKSAEATGATSTSKPSTTPVRGIVSRMEVAAEEHREELSGTPSAGAQPVRASSDKGKSRIVSGPVLLESPPLADADALDTGTVLLNVKTDSAGRVLSAAVRRSSGSSKLDSVALRQIRGSRFKAAVKNNRSVPSSFEYPYRFQKKQAKLQEQQKPQEEQKQREEHRLQDQPTQDDKSQEPEDDKQGAPLKEKTKK